MQLLTPVLLAAVLLVAPSSRLSSPEPPKPPVEDAKPDPALADLRAEATRMRPLLSMPATRELADAVPSLKPIEATSVWYRPGGGYMSEAWTAAEHAALVADGAEDLADLREMTVDTRRYYYTFYGSPLASLRAFDLAAKYGIESFAGKRVLDFGFGSVGQLELLAACGAEAVGAEVMPLLRAIYDPARERAGRTGAVSMVFGQWPAEPRVIDAVGGGFDLFVSKNTLKRGYVNPQVEVDPKRRMQFGVEQGVFLDRLREAMNPGGLILIYNIGGAPPAEGEPYVPATDIASPWDAKTYEDHGFEVLVLDVDDSLDIRPFGAALGWDEGEGGMDLENGLFAKYTVLRRP